jgi:hypothetical protein
MNKGKLPVMIQSFDTDEQRDDAKRQLREVGSKIFPNVIKNNIILNEFAEKKRSAAGVVITFRQLADERRFSKVKEIITPISTKKKKGVKRPDFNIEYNKQWQTPSQARLTPKKDDIETLVTPDNKKNFQQQGNYCFLTFILLYLIFCI